MDPTERSRITEVIFKKTHEPKVQEPLERSGVNRQEWRGPRDMCGIGELTVMVVRKSSVDTTFWTRKLKKIEHLTVSVYENVSCYF